MVTNLSQKKIVFCEACSPLRVPFFVWVKLSGKPKVEGTKVLPVVMNRRLKSEAIDQFRFEVVKRTRHGW